jgi:hypothetical protein
VTNDVPGPIVGFRSWGVGKLEDELYLVSPGRGVVWPLEGPLHAEHPESDADRLTAIGHKVPEEGCSCGIYAYRRLSPYLAIMRHRIAGEVNMWGRMVVHEYGYRAEYGQVRRLFARDGDPDWKRVVFVLADRYDVQVIT